MKFVGFQATIFLFISNALLPHKSSAYYQKSYAKIVYEWGVLEFDYPSEKARYEAIEKGRLQPFNVAITDIDYHGKAYRIKSCLDVMKILCFFYSSYQTIFRYDTPLKNWLPGNLISGKRQRAFETFSKLAAV